MTLNEVLERIKEKLYGSVADDAELDTLRLSFLSQKFSLGFLIDIISKYKLAGVTFTLNKSNDESHFGASIIWLTPKEILSELNDVEPGVSVGSLGFIPVGSCAEGSGDPYFLDMRNSSENPPFVRVPHEYATASRYPLDKIERVTPTLSDFFKLSKVEERV